ncbi:MAG: ABC transporter ATP-binding protein [Sulfurospirillum sp.]|nr:MAG: ABC transporter ATP-binding protein [Sulfurospirillum sp.]
MIETITATSSETSETTLLRATDLAHAFDYTLFENINIAIREKESIAILGVSGSGKSTLLHILSTLLEPNHGKVYYRGLDMYSQNDKKLLEIRRKEIGIIFQSHYLFKGFTAKENLQISSLIAGKNINLDIIRKLKIEDTLSKNVSVLSGGQQQRVSIARVLIKQPRVIFADEPTGNLDRETANDVMDVMLQYTTERKGGLFIVTHDEKIAARCNTVYRLKEKRLVPVIL